MKTLLMAVVMTGLTLNGLPAQVLLSDIYSPTTASSGSIPYAESDFISIRMRGLGYQLHNVVRDDVTDLFRNPVTIYNLNGPLVFASYEQPTNPPVRFQMLPVNNHYLSIGYWSKNFIGTSRPAGFFLRGSLSNSERVGQQDPPWENPFTTQEDFKSLTSQSKFRELYGKFWLGLMKKQYFNLGFSYDLFISNNRSTNESKHTTIDSNNWNREITLNNHSNSKDDWYRHRFAIGSSFNSGKWKIEPEVALLLFSNNQNLDRENNSMQIDTALENPDSLLRFRERKYKDLFNFEYNLTGIEVDLQTSRKSVTFFFTGSFLNFSPRENKDSFNKDFEIFYGDTVRNNIRNLKFGFNNDGKLYRTRIGLGKSFSIKRKFHIYSSAVFEFFRSDLKGNLSFNGLDQKVSSSNSSIVDTSWMNPLNYSNEKIRLLLPVGFEYRGNIFSARLGLSYYYSYAKMNIESQQADVPDYIQKISSSTFAGQEFFGLGFHWKGAELNIAAVSEVFKFSSWQVGFRYRL